MKQVKGWGVAWRMKLPDNKIAKGIIKRRNRTECERLAEAGKILEMVTA
jgi:hypothetical protein